MKQVLQHVRSRTLEVADVPEPYGKSGGVVVRNAVSLISAGTERMMIDFAMQSMLGKARKRPDLVRQVLNKVRNDGLKPTVDAVLSRLDQPLPLGYSCAGVVEHVGRGAGEFAEGDRVACAGAGYASHAPRASARRTWPVASPAPVPSEAARSAPLGATGMPGVRPAGGRLGEPGAVTGLGRRVRSRSKS